MDRIKQVGYIGLGLMGGHIARNILKGGYETIVYNRSREKTLLLVDEGAIEGRSPADVAQHSDVVFTNLPDTPDVFQVVLGKDGILECAKSGLIIVDNSTIKPSAVKELAKKCQEQDVYFLDAPVSGGDIGAKNGTLTIMVGGEENVLQMVMPVLEKIGKKITHVGGSGAGQIAKAANQIMVAAQMVAMAELLVFSKKCGADPKKVIEAIKEGAAQCWTLDVKPQRLFNGDRSPGFKSSMQAKDLSIIMETAKEFQLSLPGAAISTQLFNSMLALGMADLDNSAVIGVLENLCAIRLVENS